MALNPRLRVLLIFASVFTLTSLAVWFINERRGLLRDQSEQSNAAETIATETPTPENALTESVAPLATPTPPIEVLPEATPSLTIANDESEPFFNPTPANENGYTASPTPLVNATPESFAVNAPDGAPLIPVAGVQFKDLQNTFKDARSGGRVHDAIDIIAPRGTPVIACTDGRIVKLFRSDRGGITLYQLSPDEKTVYYYAHLDRYRDGIAEGQTLRRGDVLGYVGDTGNATPGNYHLHFSVARIQTPRDIHNGTNLNPYDLFR